MTATYTLHVAPYADSGDPNALQHAELVRDGFSWGAFLVPTLWYLWHRHWLAALAAFVITLAFPWGLRLAGVGIGATLLAQALLHLLHGFEGSSIRRWLYARAGRPAVDVVQAGSADEAELKSVARWLPAAAPLRAQSFSEEPALAPLRSRYEPVIGLFPDAEGRA
jgi:hypothetical protein